MMNDTVQIALIVAVPTILASLLSFFTARNGAKQAAIAAAEAAEAKRKIEEVHNEIVQKVVPVLAETVVPLLNKVAKTKRSKGSS